MKRLYGVVGLMLCALMGVALMSSAALAKKPAKPKQAAVKNVPITPGSQYLALGDSFSFGYVESNVVPAPNYKDPASFVGYPEVLASELHLRLANASCPGETSSSFIDTAGPSNGCTNRPAGQTQPSYRALYPLHVSYKGSQLAYAMSYLKSHHHVRLVSLMIGGNDYLRCLETTKDLCTSSSEASTLAATITKNIHTILSAIRNKAHYRGQIVLVNYYAPLAALSAAAVHYNAVEASAAKPFHVEFADTYDQFVRAEVHSHGNVCTAGLVTQLSSGGCGIHPSDAGIALMSFAVEKAIKLG